jgi:hypothetical protein
MTDLTPFYKVGDKIINLDNVSSIGFIPAKNRVVYNMNHSIETIDRTLNEAIMIADYKYYNFDVESEYQEHCTEIRGHSMLFGYVQSTSDYHHLVNPLNVSYINFEKENKRIIFNLSTPVTKRKYGTNTKIEPGILTNDFVFWTYTTEEEYEANVKYINEELLND